MNMYGTAVGVPWRNSRAPTLAKAIIQINQTIQEIHQKILAVIKTIITFIDIIIMKIQFSARGLKEEH